MALTNSLSDTIQSLDSVGQSMARRVFTVVDVTPTVGEWRSGTLVTISSEVTIGLPILQCRQVALRNTHASAKITVKWTPTTGAEATICILGPGDGINLWHQVAGSTYGISSLKLTPDTAATTYEMFLGG